MKALKVLYRPPGKGAERRSAIPSRHAVLYRQGRMAKPPIGKLMVYLDRLDAEGFCRIAGEWWWDGRWTHLDADKGSLEVWSVECHNLYRIDYLLSAYSLEKADLTSTVMANFWRIVNAGRNPCMEHVTWSKRAMVQVWTTDSVIPQELLATYDINGKNFSEEDNP